MTKDIDGKPGHPSAVHLSWCLKMAQHSQPAWTVIQSAILQEGMVEQIFSSLKTTRRTTMQGDTRNDLLEIYVEGPTLSPFCPDHAIELWWSDCSTTRSVNQQAKKEYLSQTQIPHKKNKSSS